MSFALLAQSTRADDKQAIRAAVVDALGDPDLTRVIVEPRVGERIAPNTADEADLYLAQVVAALMLAERLDVEVAYVPAEATRATKHLRLPSGPRARELGEEGAALATPLIRDDAATVLMGRARHLGAEGAKLHGETYVDDQRIFTGEVRGILIETTIEEPGLRAQIERPLIPGRWHVGRAVQTGGTNLVVEREGVVTERVVRRSTFYRNDVDLKIVRSA